MAGMMRNINVLSRCAAINRKQSSKEKLDGVYHSYIIAIHYHPGLSQDRLSRHICFSKSSVTRHLTFLEENGYITRCAGKDKRELLVFPTEKLEKAFEEVSKISKNWCNAVTQELSEEEKELATRILEKMAGKARELVFGVEVEE